MAPLQRPLPRTAAHAFVSDLSSPSLDDDDRRHLERSLRLRPGEAVTVSDGAGRWRLCSWRADGGLEPEGPEVDEGLSEPAVTVAFALTKGERPDWVVQKLTEVGVDAIVAFRSARSVVRWDEAKAAGHLARWRRVAKEAAMQSRRARLPDVSGVVGFWDVVTSMSGVAGIAAAGAGPAGPSLERPALVVGPEGGWDADELACGLPAVTLGPTVLRAETAAVAGAVLLCGLRDGTIPAFPAQDADFGHTP